MKHIKLFEDYTGDDKYLKRKQHFVFQEIKFPYEYFAGTFSEPQKDIFFGDTTPYKKYAKKFKTRKEAEIYHIQHKDKLSTYDFEINEIFI
jgi:hypothetical protein